MDPLSTVRRRLAEQRLAGDPFTTVAEAVSWFGAVQGQEYAEAKWSLGERIDACTDADVEAAFNRGEIIRTHVLRPTWHLMAREDVRWLLRLTGPRVHALNRFYYHKLELEAEVLSRGQRVFSESLRDGPVTRRELAEHLAAAGIVADSLRLAYLLMHAELEEVICSGPRRGKQQTYAILDDRVPTSPRDRRPRDQALDELVLRYFRSHGPATVKDFTAWSSLTVADTKAALERLGSQLGRIVDGARKSWYAAPKARRSSSRASGAYLIPTYDETIVAYQDLRVVLAHEPVRPDLLLRCIVIDGRTYGTWKRTLSARSVVVEAGLFGAISETESAALEGAAKRFGRFLGLPAVLETRQLT